MTVPFKKGNIRYYPISNNQFTESIINCDGVITGGGFETPAEVLFLGKKLMSIPIRDHYEQKCNAAALKKLGVTILDDINLKNFHKILDSWINRPPISYRQKANNIYDTLEVVMGHHKMMVI